MRMKCGAVIRGKTEAKSFCAKMHVGTILISCSNAPAPKG